jgi:hypothetical protein
MAVTEVCDYNRSFLRFRIDTTKKPLKTVSHEPPFTVNNVRVPLDCRVLVHDRETRATKQIVLGGNCKTERVNVPKDVWTEPNADVVFVATDDQYLIIKSWDHLARRVMLFPESLGPQPRRQVVSVADVFDRASIDVRTVAGTVLEANDQIIEAIAGDSPLVSRTEIEHGRYRATIEYPIRTVNVSERDGFYQTDTGPILLPDLDRKPDELIDGCDLAFVAHNAPDWAEFIVRVPTKINDDVTVDHYSKSVRLTVRNTVVRCD